ncbi:hypothetical protein OG746_38520 [Streptomyces sp. NBC_01016]|uniref:hypothetical protein n=1 Tax=Streptomyces sp. NBC_01016 TaxID=2903720 RepID=UPI00225B559E|nr:hypothetical protein [Streptomyces sp. NBC_01016]MCX4834599.1 hypothetical protein [Streptomyces sp. NBC_01016]
MLPRNWSRALLAAPAVAVLVTATGCASAKDAEPEKKTFSFQGNTLDVRSHGIPTDLVASGRDDVLVTRWFDVGLGADDEASWELAKGALDLRAMCSKLANCDVRFKVEVPKSVKVLRNGRPTDLKGAKSQAAGSPSQAATAIRTRV